MKESLADLYQESLLTDCTTDADMSDSEAMALLMDDDSEMSDEMAEMLLL